VGLCVIGRLLLESPGGIREPILISDCFNTSLKLYSSYYTSLASTSQHACPSPSPLISASAAAQPSPKAAATSSPSTTNASTTAPQLFLHILVVVGLEAACAAEEKALEGAKLEAQISEEEGRQTKQIDYSWCELYLNFGYERDVVEEQFFESASMSRVVGSGNCTS
jgi:hypothetical protein